MLLSPQHGESKRYWGGAGGAHRPEMQRFRFMQQQGRIGEEQGLPQLEPHTLQRRAGDGTNAP